MKFLAALALTVVGFLAGCAFTQYRVQTILLPAIINSYSLFWGELVMRFVEEADAGGGAMARKRAIAVARSQLVPLSPLSPQWEYLLPPFGLTSEKALRSYTHSDSRTLAKLEARLRTAENVAPPSP